jgi:hypothetical protein
MKPTNTEKEQRKEDKWEYNGGGELVQSTLYPYMEASQ